MRTSASRKVSPELSKAGACSTSGGVPAARSMQKRLRCNRALARTNPGGGIEVTGLIGSRRSQSNRHASQRGSSRPPVPPAKSCISRGGPGAGTSLAFMPVVVNVGGGFLGAAHGPESVDTADRKSDGRGLAIPSPACGFETARSRPAATTSPRRVEGRAIIPTSSIPQWPASLKGRRHHRPSWPRSRRCGRCQCQASPEA